MEHQGGSNWPADLTENTATPKEVETPGQEPSRTRWTSPGREVGLFPTGWKSQQ